MSHQKEKESIRDILQDMGLQACIKAFEEQQVTTEVVPEMSEDHLIQLGVSLIGQRYQLKNRCKKIVGNSTPTPKGILKLIQHIGDNKKKRSSKNNEGASCSHSGQSSKLCLSVGWKHFCKSKKLYKQVYSIKGGGTTNLYMEPELNYEECVHRIEEVFFPDGKNGQQRLHHLDRSLANYVGDPIKSTLTLPDGPCQFTVGTYCEYCKTQKKRIYLLTKDIISPPDSDSDDDFVDPKLDVTRRRRRDDSGIVSTKSHSSKGPTPEIECDDTLPVPVASSTPARDPKDIYSELIVIDDSDEDLPEVRLEEAETSRSSKKQCITRPHEAKQVMQQIKTHLQILKMEHITEEAEAPCTHLRIRRNAIWQDTLRVFKKGSFDPSKPLKVTFLGEPAVDQGGPLREFFSEILRYIFSSSSMFTGDQCKAITHNTGALLKEEFRIAGQVLAMSLVHGGRSPSCISHVQYDYMVHQSIHTLEPCLADIMDTAIKDKADLIMRSVDDPTVDSLLKSEEMMDMLVTCGVTPKVRYSLRDRHDIVVELAVHDLVLKVNAELHQFMDGLKLYGILDFFKSNYEAGRSLMCSGNVFMPTPDDFIDDMDEPEYSAEGGNRHKLEVDVYAYFIQFVENFSDEGTINCEGRDVGMGDLLYFITGSPTYPPLGLPSKPRVKFTHDCYVHTTPLANQRCRCFPVVSTCSLTLTLPVHFVSYCAFQKVMCVAILCSKGFGKV